MKGCPLYQQLTEDSTVPPSSGRSVSVSRGKRRERGGGEREYPSRRVGRYQPLEGGGVPASSGWSGISLSREGKGKGRERRGVIVLNSNQQAKSQSKTKTFPSQDTCYDTKPVFISKLIRRQNAIWIILSKRLRERPALEVMEPPISYFTLGPG